MRAASASLLLLLAAKALFAEGPAVAETEPNYEVVGSGAADFVGLYYPKEFADFQQQAVKGLDKSSAEKLLALITQCGNQLKNNSLKGKQLWENRLIYGALWRVADHFVRKTQDGAAKELIVEAWNRGLTRPLAVSQILFLADGEKHKLFNEHFQIVFLESEDIRIVEACAYALCHLGGSDAKDLLQRKLRPLKNRHAI